MSHVAECNFAQSIIFDSSVPHLLLVSIDTDGKWQVLIVCVDPIVTFCSRTSFLQNILTFMSGFLSSHLYDVYFDLSLHSLRIKEVEFGNAILLVCCSNSADLPKLHAIVELLTVLYCKYSRKLGLNPFATNIQMVRLHIKRFPTMLTTSMDFDAFYA